MSQYTPDKWVVVHITTKSGEQIDKVLAGWYGGFAGSDHWQLNSGIKQVVELDDRFEFHGYSGSLYVCYKHCYGLSSLTGSMLRHWQSQGVKMKVLEEYDVRSNS